MKKKMMTAALLGMLIIGITGCDEQEKTDTDSSVFSEEAETGNEMIQEKIDLEQCLGDNIENIGQGIELFPSAQPGFDYSTDNGQIDFSTSSDGTITDIYMKSESTYAFAGIKCGMNIDEIEEKFSENDFYQYSIDVLGSEVVFWEKDDINTGGSCHLGSGYNCEEINVTTEFSGYYKLYKEEQPYILFESVYRRLTDEDVDEFDKETLSKAIDEIYAREGMEFDSLEKKDLYKSYLWYNPTIPEEEFSDDMLSEVEKYNIRFLKSQIEEIDDKEIEKQEIVERGYTEGTYKNPDGYIIVMRNREDGNFEKIKNMFSVEIYYPNGEILCEENRMELDTYTALLVGYQCDIEQLSDGTLNLLLGADLMYQMGLDPFTDVSVIEGFNMID